MGAERAVVLADESAAIAETVMQVPASARHAGRRI
jgi:hypothetical protein